MSERKRASCSSSKDSGPADAADENSTNPAESINMVQPFKKKSISQSDRKEQQSKALATISKFISISDIYAKAWETQQEQNKLNTTSQTENAYFQGVLREYQVTGVQWLETLFLSGINGILADEMGLGKTVQVIAFLAKLQTQGIKGMHLISVPLSTVPNWMSEFKRFAPKFPVLKYHGTPDERMEIHKQILLTSKQSPNTTDVFPVVIVPHHYTANSIHVFSNTKFVCLIIDEGHRIKNHLSQMSQAVRQIKCRNKLLLTGTPLQNNMMELWSLLNFIMPTFFSNMEAFDQLIQAEDLANESAITTNLGESSTVVQTIQRVVKPFILRRMKEDVLPEKMPMISHRVYCEMSPEQADLYTGALQRDLARLKGETAAQQELPPKRRRQPRTMEEKRPEPPTMMRCLRLQNPIMLYRRIVNHPYLVNAPLIPGTPYLQVDERLVTISGKLRVLDVLLQKLLARGHKVIIFSTLVIMLDLIGDYLQMRAIPYVSLTGRDALESRAKDIDRFNNEEALSVFLLSTRAGGQGINLTAADTVIFYDSDWNPQADLQAQARCHRIGQTKPVIVYTLISRNSIDEYILRTAELKLRLEKAIMMNGPREKLNGNTIQELLDFLNKAKEETKIVYPNGIALSDAQLDALLDRTELQEIIDAAASDTPSTS